MFRHRRQRAAAVPRIQTALWELLLWFDGAVIILSLALGLVFFAGAVGTYIVDYRLYAAAQRSIETAQMFSISKVSSLCPQVGRDRESSTLVAVSGEVHPRSYDNILHYSSVSPEYEAVVKEYTRKLVYREGMIPFRCIFNLLGGFSNMRELSESKTVENVPFIILDRDYRLNFSVNLDGSKHSLPLIRVSSLFEPVQPPPSPYKQFFWRLGNRIDHLEEKRILRVGQMITAIGICSMQDGILEIRSSEKIPYFLSGLSKDRIEYDLTAKSLHLLHQSVLFGLVSMFLLGYSACRNWAEVNSWGTHAEQLIEGAIKKMCFAGKKLIKVSMDETRFAAKQLIKDAINKMGFSGKLIEAAQWPECVICLTSERNYVFVPCGHLVCCRTCAPRVAQDEDPRCPICRKEILISVKVYKS